MKCGCNELTPSSDNNMYIIHTFNIIIYIYNNYIYNIIYCCISTIVKHIQYLGPIMAFTTGLNPKQNIAGPTLQLG